LTLKVGEYIERQESEVKCGMFQTYEKAGGKGGGASAPSGGGDGAASGGADHGPSGSSGASASMPRRTRQRRAMASLVCSQERRMASLAAESAEWKRKPSRSNVGSRALLASDGWVCSTVERTSVESSGQRMSGSLHTQETHKRAPRVPIALSADCAQCRLRSAARELSGELRAGLALAACRGRRAAA
jgi:hypothetical protein